MGILQLSVTVNEDLLQNLWALLSIKYTLDKRMCKKKHLWTMCFFSTWTLFWDNFAYILVRVTFAFHIVCEQIIRIPNHPCLADSCQCPHVLTAGESICNLTHQAEIIGPAFLHYQHIDFGDSCHHCASQAAKCGHAV